MVLFDHNSGQPALLRSDRSSYAADTASHNDYIHIRHEDAPVLPDVPGWTAP